MINQDIQFEIVNENGINVNCVVIATVPVNENEINIMYKREDEADDIFRYGKIIKTESTYEIKKNITEEELIILKESFDDQILNIANSILSEEV